MLDSIRSSRITPFVLLALSACDLAGPVRPMDPIAQVQEPLPPVPDIVVYPRSASEVWVYDSRPELGIGTHLWEPLDVSALNRMNARFIRNTMMWSQWYEHPAQMQAWWDFGPTHIFQPNDYDPVILVHTEPDGYGWKNRTEAFHLLARDMKRIAAANPEVRFWELFNEQNVGFGTLFGQHLHDWKKQVDRWVPYRERGRIYGEMLKIVYPAVKEANPNAWVVMGGITSSHGAGPDHRVTSLESITEFMRGMYEAGARDYFDIANIHTYGLPLRATFAAHGIEIKRVMHEYGDYYKPLINSEFGVSAANTICAWGEPSRWAAGENPFDAFDRVQREQLQDAVLWNDHSRVYWKLSPYQMFAEAEMHDCHASLAARDTMTLPQGRTWNDYSHGVLRFDRQQSRPAYDWMASYNRSRPMRPTRTDATFRLAKGLVPRDYAYTLHGDTAVTVHNVPLEVGAPTRILLAPADSTSRSSSADRDAG